MRIGRKFYKYQAVFNPSTDTSTESHLDLSNQSIVGNCMHGRFYSSGASKYPVEMLIASHFRYNSQ